MVLFESVYKNGVHVATSRRDIADSLETYFDEKLPISVMDLSDVFKDIGEAISDVIEHHSDEAIGSRTKYFVNLEAKKHESDKYNELVYSAISETGDRYVLHYIMFDMTNN